MSLPQVEYKGQLLKTKANLLCSATRKVKSVLVLLDGQLVWLERNEFSLPTFASMGGLK
jgi:hypothetical protein